MPGGSLFIEIGDDEEIPMCIGMTGPVEGVFEGCFHADLIEKIPKAK